MLYLIFKLGDETFAIRSDSIVEVVPQIPLKHVPHAPPHLLGLMNYRGAILPVIDLRQLIFAESCTPCLSTRILLVEHKRAGRIIGLVAEQVTETISRDPAEFKLPLIRVESAPYLGGVAIHEGGMLQELRMEMLLTESLRGTLIDQHAYAASMTDEGEA